MSARVQTVEAWVEQARELPIETGLLGGIVPWKNGGKGIERCGPCPVCGGNDRFSINAIKRVWNCRGCAKGGDVISLAQHVAGVGFHEAVALLVGERADDGRHRNDDEARREAKARDEAERIAKARWLWSRRVPIQGTPAERYLIECRKLRGPFQPTLAYLPASGDHPHAMIAPFGTADDPHEPGVLAIDAARIMAVHLTKLNADRSGKAPGDDNKITIGRPLGSPIVLAPPNDLLGLVIAEGIEDALSSHEKTGLGAWAAGSAGYLPALAEAVPSYIDCVTLIVDADVPGRRNAKALGTLLKARGIECKFTLLGGAEKAHAS